jgi:hypothetical protein
MNFSHAHPPSIEHLEMGSARTRSRCAMCMGLRTLGRRTGGWDCWPISRLRDVTCL